MLYRQMQYFAAVVECGSFTEAARRCYISQSAVSQQVQALETELGVQLLHRENRRFSLTPAGKYFYRHCREILSETELLRRETGLLGQEERPQLRIGCPHCFGGQELQQAAAAFSERFPGIGFSLLRAAHGELFELLHSKGADLILTGGQPAPPEEYACRPLWCCSPKIELSARSLPGAGEQVQAQDLRQLPCILISPPGQRESELAYWQHILSPSSHFLFAETLEEGRLMAAGGRGFLPVEGALLPAPAPALCRKTLWRGEALQQSYCAFWIKDQAGAEQFAGLLHGLPVP